MQFDSNGGMSQTLVVTRIVSTEKPVACDPLATDRSFAGTRWLVETDGEAKYPGYAMRFGDRDRFEGSDACNLIFGRFEMKSDHQFIVRDMHSTLRACPGGSYPGGICATAAPKTVTYSHILRTAPPGHRRVPCSPAISPP